MNDGPNSLASAGRFFRSIQNRLESNDSSEIEQSADFVLNSISNHLDDGDQIAFLKRLENGTFKLTTLSIEKDGDGES